MKKPFASKENKKSFIPLKNSTKQNKIFSDGFFRFLLGFTIIVGLSFATLVIFGLTNTPT